MAKISILPFFLAWRWLRAPRHHEELLKVLVITGFVYSLLAIIEMRLSPQINRTVYGYFPHSWQQHVRGGQFRPVVFLRHGLWLAFFLLSASFAAFGLYKSLKEPFARILYLSAGLWILAVLFISPNLGAAMLAVVFAPVIFLAPRAIQARIIMVAAVVFLIFPSVRQANLVPLNSFLNYVSTISAERAQSLLFRLENEDDMLARASAKPLFGWGGWGRWRVIDPKGRDTTVSDGLWIITLGERGWAGYLSIFGLMVAPLILLARTHRRRSLSPATLTLGMISAANLVYLVPNSALSPAGWAVFGAVAGAISWRPVANAAESELMEQDTRGHPRYSRFAYSQRQTASPAPEDPGPSPHTRYSRS